MFKSKKQNRRGIAVAVALALALVAPVIAPPARAQGNGNPGVIPVNNQYVNLSAQWWQWAFSFQVSNNPLLDETGASACLGQQQRSNVFFLAGVFNVSGTATRSITVPAGARLFFPILNGEWDVVGEDPNITVEELRAKVAVFIDSINELHASIDGQAVPNLFNYRVKSNPFDYTQPATDNLYQFFGVPDAFLAPFACSAGFCVYPAVSDGYWLLLNPLPNGQHTINFGGSNGGFTLDITYNITVVPRGQYQGCP